jgi:hypothetical protein
MAKGTLKHVAVKVGASIRRAERTRQRVMALKRQLLKNTEGTQMHPVNHS